MKLHLKSEINSKIDLLNELIPFNLEPKQSSVQEYLKIKNQYYLIFDSRVKSDQVIVHELEVEQALGRIVDFYDWRNCFHPLDIVQWQKVYDHFDLGNFFDSTIFSQSIKSQKKNLESVACADTTLIQLMLTKKIDFRMISFLEGFGFKMNVFFEYIFQEGSFNFQMQKKIVENFGSLFRRKKIDVELFLNDNKELITQKIQNKSSFIQWMNELTRPKLVNELKRRNSILNQVEFGSNISIKLDETLEDAWVNIQFQADDMQEYLETLENLSTTKNKSTMQNFFEEC